MSDLAEMLIHADVGHAPPSARWPGVYPALVTDIVDPDAQGRVQVSLPWSPDPAAALPGLGAAGHPDGRSERGSWFIPDKGDEVLVAFEGGDPRSPLRARWSVERLRRAAASPWTARGTTTRRSSSTRNGVKVTLDDTDGSEQLMLETPGGQQLTLKDGPGSITIQDANGNSGHARLERDHGHRLG